MKAFLLSASAVLFSLVSQAQSYELGINGGISTTSKPHQSLYKGDDNIWNYAASVNFRYNITPHLQTGITAGLTKWERMDNWPLSNTSNMSLGEQNVKVVLAEHAVNFQLELNYVVPFYRQYEDFIRSNLYFGVAAGAVIVGNDGKISYSRVNPNTPAEYTYTSELHFESGYGFTVGAQLGYSYFFNNHLGLNVEVAPKVAWVETKDPRYAGGNNQYNLFYYPTTIGIHYRFGYDKRY